MSEPTFKISAEAASWTPEERRRRIAEAFSVILQERRSGSAQDEKHKHGQQQS